MRYRIYFLVITLFALNACQQVGNNNEKEAQAAEEKMFPSDYLFAQRSFPYGKIDLDAYKSSTEFRAKSQSNEKTIFDKKWESKGPTNVSGRITDLEMIRGNFDIIYAGSASGGIFKSSDQGKSWKAIFDDAKSLSIGDIAIYQKHPETIYVGTGESNAGGGSLAYDGLGVYRSDDAGDTWKSLGPDNVGSIGKVVIDPDNPDIAYIAAMGTLFANNSERGVFKTNDGGETWNNVLMVSDSTGAVDLAIHPTDGEILYAAMWERIRRPYNRQYGGKTSGLYKSTNGGETWQELTNGLPTGDSQKGRIGIAISESVPEILYAYYANSDGSLNGVFKTENAGTNWQRMSNQNISNVPFIWWFGKIFVHPTNPDLVYVTSLNMYRSINGGEDWDYIFQDAHVDHHAMYLQPNINFAINGNDGGIRLGDGPLMETSAPLDGFSNFQFYTCEIDPNNPNIIYGGAQDNGTNRTEGGISDWTHLFGGDGFRVLVDPNNSQQIYVEYQYGNIFGSSDGGNQFYNAGGGLDGSFNWNTPIAMDPNNSSTLYTGAQQLYRSDDFANSWEPISGILINTDNPSGNLTFGSLTTIDVSKLNSNIIYTGSDDGNVWVSKDQGATFENISQGIPERWITSISHDPHVESGVFVSVSGFRFGEADAQIFYSDDYGQNWKAIGESLPDVPINDIIADDLLDGILYAASDIGVFASEDDGQKWSLMGKEMPNVPITDIDFDSNSRTLAAASFGRGMFTYELPLMVNTDEPETADHQIIVYPNPAKEFIQIQSEHEVKSLLLYDLQGRLLRSVSDKNKLNVNDVSTGNYFLRISFDDSEFVKQVNIH